MSPHCRCPACACRQPPSALHARPRPLLPAPAAVAPTAAPAPACVCGWLLLLLLLLLLLPALLLGQVLCRTADAGAPQCEAGHRHLSRAHPATAVQPSRPGTDVEPPARAAAVCGNLTVTMQMCSWPLHGNDSCHVGKYSDQVTAHNSNGISCSQDSCCLNKPTLTSSLLLIVDMTLK